MLQLLSGHWQIATAGRWMTTHIPFRALALALLLVSAAAMSDLALPVERRTDLTATIVGRHIAQDAGGRERYYVTYQYAASPAGSSAPSAAVRDEEVLPHLYDLLAPGAQVQIGFLEGAPVREPAIIDIHR